MDTQTLTMKILVIDVGGTHVKFLANEQSDLREFASGSKMTAKQMVAGVRKSTSDWQYDAVTIGFPSPCCTEKSLSSRATLVAAGSVMILRKCLSVRFAGSQL